MEDEFNSGQIPKDHPCFNAFCPLGSNGDFLDCRNLDNSHFADYSLEQSLVFSPRSLLFFSPCEEMSNSHYDEENNYGQISQPFSNDSNNISSNGQQNFSNIPHEIFFQDHEIKDRKEFPLLYCDESQIPYNKTKAISNDLFISFKEVKKLEEMKFSPSEILKRKLLKDLTNIAINNSEEEKMTEKKKERSKEEEVSSKKHPKTSSDLIKNKISNFIKDALVDYYNEQIKKFEEKGKQGQFQLLKVNIPKDLNKKIKKIVTLITKKSPMPNELKELKALDVIYREISKRFYRKSPNQNMKNIDKFFKIYPPEEYSISKELFELTIADFYQNVFLQDNDLDEDIKKYSLDGIIQNKLDNAEKNNTGGQGFKGAYYLSRFKFFAGK